MKKMLSFTMLILVVSVSFFLSCQTPEERRPGPRAAFSQGSEAVRTPYIDVHNHLFGGSMRGENYIGAANSALSTMDKLGIRKMLVMPPPLSASLPVLFDVEELLPAVRKHPDRFATLGGGGTLNVMIHRAHKEGAVTPEMRERFRARALEILARGAAGFGEFAAEHFSFAPDHPYESVPADHPLFLLLADIAGEKGVPIDLHMEAVPRDMALPDRTILTRSGRNPSSLRENLSALERLLAHERNARIIWAHAGWCNTGQRTASLCREFLAKHPNLYMSIKMSPEGVSEVRPIGPDEGSIRPEWLELFRDFPDRFMIGTDQFYGPPGARQIGPQKTESTRLLMDLLPADLARRIGTENGVRLFRLGGSS
jgi:hypothetical protein